MQHFSGLQCIYQHVHAPPLWSFHVHSTSFPACSCLQLLCLAYPRWPTTEAKCCSLCKKVKAIIWYKQTQLWALDHSPKAWPIILTLHKLSNMSFQPLCVHTLTVSMFLTDGLVYLTAKPTSCWTNNEEGGREEESGVGENAGCHLYFSLFKGWIFFNIVCWHVWRQEKMAQNLTSIFFIQVFLKWEILNHSSETCYSSNLYLH